MIKSFGKNCNHYVCRRVLGLINRRALKMSASNMACIEESIRNKLEAELEPVHLDIINESYMHNVPKGAETHFKVVVVSDKFNDLTLIKRHRLVNDTLKYELQNGVHALSIDAKTPSQWKDSDKIITSSPNCRGGFGK